MTEDFPLHIKDLPACVRLGGEQVMITIVDEGDGPKLAKYGIRVLEKDGTLRRQTRDEELAYSAAPGTRAERDAAVKRTGLAMAGKTLELIPLPWNDGDLESAIAQIERGSADTDDHN